MYFSVPSPSSVPIHNHLNASSGVTFYFKILFKDNATEAIGEFIKQLWIVFKQRELGLYGHVCVHFLRFVRLFLFICVKFVCRFVCLLIYWTLSHCPNVNSPTMQELIISCKN